MANNWVRGLLFLASFVAGLYALGAWMGGLLFDAGVAGALSAAAYLGAELVGYCQRDRYRQGREAVWRRRDEEVRW